MPIYDITIPMQASLAVWPGDTPYHLQTICSIREGAVINLATIAMSVHTGTHTDAPYHYAADGATTDRLDLNCYLGPALVMDVSGRDRICVEDFAGADFADTSRVLLRTGGWPDHACFPKQIPVMASGVPAYLKARGVVLVGLDVPSVDAIDSKELPMHHELGACGIAIIEALDLRGVPEGRYELLALPLPLVGADGAPMRAVLRSLP